MMNMSLTSSNRIEYRDRHFAENRNSDMSFSLERTAILSQEVIYGRNSLSFSHSDGMINL